MLNERGFVPVQGPSGVRFHAAKHNLPDKFRMVALRTLSDFYTVIVRAIQTTLGDKKTSQHSVGVICPVAVCGGKNWSESEF